MALPIMVFLQGCATDTRNDGSRAGHSEIEFLNNTLKVSENMPLGLVRDAAVGALNDLQIAVTVNNKTANIVRLEGQDAQNRPVVIQLKGINRQTTEVQIVVGNTDSPESRAVEQQVYDKMKVRF